jgi:hypothetical protein
VTTFEYGRVFVSTLTGAGNTKYCPLGGTMPLTAQPVPQTPEGLPILMGGLGLTAVTGAVVRRHRKAGRTELPAPTLGA